MKLLLVAAALLSQAGSEAADVMGRLTLDQLMRISALPPARVNEMHCAALALWLDHKRPDHRFALPRAETARLTSEVAAAIANDAELPKDLAEQFLAVTEAEPEGKIAEAADVEQVIRDLARPCDALFKEARDGMPLPLHPLANSSVVSPSLATCYALYKAAASRAEGDEAVKLGRDAEKAAELALQGKNGAARDAAEVALAAEAEAALKAPVAKPEAEMMRLVMCVPYLRGLNAAEGIKP